MQAWARTTNSPGSKSQERYCALKEGRKEAPRRQMGVSKKSVSWTSTFVTTVLQENGRRSDVTFLVQTFWTPPNGGIIMRTSENRGTNSSSPSENRGTNSCETLWTHHLRSSAEGAENWRTNTKHRRRTMIAEDMGHKSCI